jgi:organic radical activating enzyme
MKKIIKIKPEDPNYLRIDYVMTTQCPYSCRYCPPRLHSGKHNKIDAGMIGTFLDKFSDRKVIMHLTGGEPTTHPQFEEIVKMLYDRNINTIVDTNGIRTQRWWSEHAHLVDNWCISLHPSQLEEIDIDKIRIASEVSFTVVYVLMDPLHLDKALRWYDQLSKVPNIRLNAFRVMSVEYTEEQDEILKSMEGKWNFTTDRQAELEKTHGWLKGMGSIGYYDDGTEGIIDFAEIMRNNQHNFKGWKCSVGNESIGIHDDGTATWARCGVKKYSNFMDISPHDLKQSIICPLDYCMCGTDIRMSKQSPEILE